MPKNRKLFLADSCLTPTESFDNCAILCEKDRIIATGGASAFSMYEPGLEIVSVKGAYVVPGFIDSHIHGIGGTDASKPSRDAMTELSRMLGTHGVTTFFPTVVPQRREQLLETISTLSSIMQTPLPFADAPGLHIEGPFISQCKRGSHASDAIVPIDLEFMKEIVDAGTGKIKIMTFAPELDRAPALVTMMLENGIIPSMGHSTATEEQTLRCIDAGARRCTYIFNGMPALHHRESSLTTVALTDDRVSVELIVDGVHVHKRFVALLKRCKPLNQIIGVSNAVSGEDRNLSEGMAQLGTEAAKVIKTSDGVLAGATITLENSWQHLITYANLDRSLAASCFTRNPAIDLGLITRGELKPGLRADLTFFDSKTNKVRMTVSRGTIIYDATKNAPDEKV